MKRSMRWMWAVAALVATPLTAQQEEDPYLWLEDVEGAEALEWVEAQNATTVARLEAYAAFRDFYEQSLAILNSTQRIPYVSIMGAHVYNFWQDAQHEKGIWRRTSLTDYLTPSPSWEVVLDLDALAAAEGENWVWKGANCLYPDYNRCAVNLSRGGADAVVVREYDAAMRRFVDGGFHLPEAKGGVSWLDENTLYVGTDFGEGSLTTSGYPRMAKLWRRGTPLREAETILEGAVTDMGLWGGVQHTPEGRYEIVTRALTFYSRETYLRRGDEMVKLDLPADATPFGVFKHQLLVQLKSDWTVDGATYPQGALLSISLGAFLTGSKDFTVIVAPDERSSISGIRTTKNLLLVNMLENVRSTLYEYRFQDGAWARAPVELPPFGTIQLGSADENSDTYFINFESFLIPSSLYLATNTGETTTVKQVKNLPAFFDAEPFTAQQFEATSQDGTQIPYFVVHRKDLQFDGANPTLLYGYGGFEISMEPSYSATIGSAWLSRGGVYVLANIRGGGEFGPRWHQSALKEHRQRAYDDFIAVAQDLVARGVTSPARLGIRGGSNGGLLVGAAFTQRPDLFGAVVCRVPLLDMKRYNKLLAGASWMAEYGNPDIPEEWEYIRRYSPYHNVHPDRAYPRVFFLTSTRDDRVHPGHARKMVAKMTDQGHEVLYYENTEGGHAAATTNRQRAYMGALEFAYLWSELGRN